MVKFVQVKLNYYNYINFKNNLDYNYNYYDEEEEYNSKKRH